MGLLASCDWDLALQLCLKRSLVPPPRNKPLGAPPRSSLTSAQDSSGAFPLRRISGYTRELSRTGDQHGANKPGF